MSNMTLEIREIDSGAVIEMGGRVMYEQDSQIFHQKLDTELAQGKRWIVLDLSRVIAMSSTGLGILIAAYRILRDRGGSIKLAKISDKVRNILETTRLNTIFEVFDSVDEAVEKARSSFK
ncbi:MAG: STAS domain-containing protein [bacterium]